MTLNQQSGCSVLYEAESNYNISSGDHEDVHQISQQSFQ